MQALWSSVNRWLTWFHRWAGVALCLLFAMWFASGAVLHFVGFPSLSAVDRHAASAVIDLSRLTISPSEALSKAPTATDLRLVGVAGRPTYLAQQPTGNWVGVAGDTGEVSPPLSARDATHIAEQFGRYPAASISGAIDYDQWIVHQHFDPFRPFYRVRLSDMAKTDLYVSAQTGEVLQRTTFRQRAWNWSGAVIHWIYFTPLRKSWSAWNQVVWWLSLVALLSTTVGTWLGVIRMAANRAAGRKGFSPFHGWMRWHHIIGLLAGVIVLTWMLSGWLSMDHGRFFSHAEATRRQSLAMSGRSLGEIAAAMPLSEVRSLPAATEITFNAVGGQPFVTAYDSGGAAHVTFPDEAAVQARAQLPQALLLKGLEQLWPAHVHAILVSDAYDQVYRLAESTAGAALFGVDGDSNLRVYVDQYTGRLLAVMNASRRDYAWVYYALHTFQFPGLIQHPVLRTTLVLFLLALGFLASITGVVLSIKRLRREFAAPLQILKPMAHPSRNAL
jgi:hypothetical protein